MDEPLIDGVILKSLARYEDPRGWLTELFRDDELPAGFEPAMAYLSITHPGVARGPHEHKDQTDGFAFIDGSYEVWLWENRPGLEPGSNVLTLGEQNPSLLIVPPGVVHAYKNVGDRDAFVLNFPNRLYAGWGKREPVDEIRHEDRADAKFKL